MGACPCLDGSHHGDHDHTYAASSCHLALISRSHFATSIAQWRESTQASLCPPSHASSDLSALPVRQPLLNSLPANGTMLRRDRRLLGSVCTCALVQSGIGCPSDLRMLCWGVLGAPCLCFRPSRHPTICSTPCLACMSSWCYGPALSHLVAPAQSLDRSGYSIMEATCETRCGTGACRSTGKNTGIREVWMQTEGA